MPLPPGETSLITLRLPGTIPAATARELAAALRQAQEAGIDHRRAHKAFFARFDAVLDQRLAGPQYFEEETLAEVLAGEIMMLEETDFVVHGFAILSSHAHAVLHLPASSRLAFAPAIDLLHQPPSSSAGVWCAPNYRPTPLFGKLAGTSMRWLMPPSWRA